MPRLCFLSVLCSFGSAGAARALPEELQLVLSAGDAVEVLGLPLGVQSSRDIRAAHRRHALSCHPDRHCSGAGQATCSAAHEAMVKVNAAKDELLLRLHRGARLTDVEPEEEEIAWVLLALLGSTSVWAAHHAAGRAGRKLGGRLRRGVQNLPPGATAACRCASFGRGSRGLALLVHGYELIVRCASSITDSVRAACTVAGSVL